MSLLFRITIAERVTMISKECLQIGNKEVQQRGAGCTLDFVLASLLQHGSNLTPPSFPS